MKLEIAIKQTMEAHGCNTVSKLSKKLFPDKNKNYLHVIIANEKRGRKPYQSTIDYLKNAGIKIDYKDESGITFEVVKNITKNKTEVKNNILEFKTVKVINNEMYISYNEIKQFLPKAG